MRLTIIGSGTVSPSATRTSPSYLVESGEHLVLLDCGAGMLHHAARFGVAWQEITHVAVSHFHVDHWGELPAFLLAQTWGAFPSRSRPLTLVGPTGLRTRLAGLREAFGEWVLDPGFPVNVVELADRETVDLGGGTTLEACATPHTDESLAYSLTNGTTRLVYTGDTGPSEPLGDWARGCSLLLCECSLPESLAIAIHLTPRQAGELARRAAADMLVLTHLYPVMNAEEAVTAASVVYHGKVVVAEDGQVFSIGVE